MTKALTNLAVQNLMPRPKRFKVSAGGGLYVQVEPHGTKLWRFGYRFAGRQQTLALGVYPAMSLKAAREARDAAKEHIENGVDPAAERRRVKVEAKAAVSDPDTFEAVARAWFKLKEESIAPSYSGRIWSRLKDDILPAIGTTQVSAVDPPALLAAIRKIEDRGAITLAKRVKNYCGEIFRFAIAEGRATYDPSASIRDALRKAPPKKHRTPLKVSEIPYFLSALDSYDGEPLTRLAIWFTLLTFVRTEETRFAQWSEFEGLNGKDPIWRIPAARMKMGREHIVPLVPQVVQVLNEIRALRLKGPYVFADNTKLGVISQNRMIMACYRLGYHSRMTIHGLRGTASTVLNESNKFQPDWIELQLAHVEGSVRSAYNSAQWLPARREMMQWYADFIEQQRDIGRLL